MRLNEILRSGSKNNEGVPQYKSLNDAATLQPILAKGQLEVWYVKANFTRDFGMGYKFLDERNLLPHNEKELKRSHVLLGKIKGIGTNESGLEKLYMVMQGEVWSPKGEAYNMISKSGSYHTSMSVGDLVRKGNDLWIVDHHGFHQFTFL